MPAHCQESKAVVPRRHDCATAPTLFTYRFIEPPLQPKRLASRKVTLDACSQPHARRIEVALARGAVLVHEVDMRVSRSRA